MNENLNIHDMKLRIITKCWYDINAFPTMRDICKATGFTERTLHRFAKDHDLPRRTRAKMRELIISQYIKEHA
jgi:hypothetical protein